MLAVEKLLGIEVPIRAAVHPRAVRRDRPHPQSSAQPHDLRHGRRRDDAAAVGLRGAREADGVLRARLAARGCTPPISAPAACIRTCRPALVDDIAAWCETFPQVLDDMEALLTENRIFKQRTVDIGIVTRRGGAATGAFPARCCAPRGVAWDLRKAQPYDVYDQMDFDIPIGKNGDCYDRYLLRLEEMRQSLKIMKQCVERDAGRAGHVGRQEGHAAAPRRDEALDGSADPSLQALYRGLSRAGGRDLCGGRGAQGRVRRLSGLRRHQQALSLQDPRAGLRPPAGDGFHVQGPHAGRRRRRSSARMDIVFGEVDR